MAAITSANVVIHQTYEVGTRSGKQLGVGVLATITLAAQGATAGDIPPSVFGLKQFLFVQPLSATISAVKRWVPFGLANFGLDDNYIFPVDLMQATDANRGIPANLTGTFTVYVEGIPASA